MFSRRVAHFAPAAAASASVFFSGMSSDTTALLSNRIGTKLHRSVIRNLSTETKPLKPTPPPPTTTAKSNGGFVDWYEGHLTTNPVPTKMVTGSILWGLGDMVAQTVPVYAAGGSLDTYDFLRSGRAVFFGFAIHAPLSHVHFNLLERLTVRSGVTGIGIPIFKTFMEQFVYWSWISNSLYHGAMGAMQGHSPEKIYNHISDVLWETQKAQWVFWIPIQMLNFKFVPIRHQLNVVLVVSIVWTALLSMWYPPSVEDGARPSDETKKLLESE